ncbi:MAG: desulfoferrodoxin FeS4 iron-binding domain-containing protein [Methanofastidiosum sp.]|jgi:desulfoferrodoxin-like iron-binding protein|nr:desulfoferrodoxin FeS4 iron-binding domain-containing protein [Methanofastidiosum sp.]
MVNVKEVGEIYKCEICGNIVEVLEVGGGELICCGEPMILQE